MPLLSSQSKELIFPKPQTPSNLSLPYNFQSSSINVPSAKSMINPLQFVHLVRVELTVLLIHLLLKHANNASIIQFAWEDLLHTLLKVIGELMLSLKISLNALNLNLACIL